MANCNESICRSCFHSYVCEQFNENKNIKNNKCHFFNDHFVPTADVVEVKHGYWIENDYRRFDGFETVVYPNEALKCSECSHNF